jgi:hypothetical protein
MFQTQVKIWRENDDVINVKKQACQVTPAMTMFTNRWN